jgi:Flp pilus assembly protein TadB
MKRGDIIGFIIVVVIIIGVIVWLATESEDDKQSESLPGDKPSSRPGFLERLGNRCERIQQEIDSQLEKLQLTTEMQQAADQFADQLKLAAKIFLAILTTAVLYGFVSNGIEIWTAILTLAAFVGVVIPVMTFFFFKNVMTLEALINWFFLHMRNAIYKKYGCDPATIKGIQQNIVVQQKIVTILKDELKREA